MNEDLLNGSTAPRAALGIGLCRSRHKPIPNLDALRRAADDPVVRLLLSAASRHVEADLAFVDDAESALLADGGATLAALAGTAAGPTTHDADPARPRATMANDTDPAPAAG